MLEDITDLDQMHIATTTIPTAIHNRATIQATILEEAIPQVGIHQATMIPAGAQD